MDKISENYGSFTEYIKAFLQTFLGWIIGVIALCIMFGFDSCATKQYSEQYNDEYKEQIKDSVRWITNVKDSIAIKWIEKQKDSSVVIVDEQGNVKRTDNYHYIYRSKDSDKKNVVTEYIYKDRYKNIYHNVYHKVYVKVTPRETWWCKLSRKIGNLLLITAILAIIGGIIYLYRKPIINFIKGKIKGF